MVERKSIKETKKKIENVEKKIEKTDDENEKDSLKIIRNSYKELLELKKMNGGYIGFKKVE